MMYKVKLSKGEQIGWFNYLLHKDVRVCEMEGARTFASREDAEKMKNKVHLTLDDELTEVDVIPIWNGGI